MVAELPSVAYRISKREHAQSTELALSGIGGLYAPGRWHTQGRPIVYASASRSLCTLERLVHADLDLWRSLAGSIFLTIAIPPIAYQTITLDHLESCDPDWTREENDLCRQIGDEWIDKGETAILLVPSAVLPYEMNILVNPKHSDHGILLRANAQITQSLADPDCRLEKLIRANG